MNDELRVFSYEAQQIRTVTINDELWFVGKDICDHFGDTNYRRSLARLEEDEKGVSPIDTPGGRQNMSIVNESGLYSLLFMMQPQQANLPKEQYETRINQIKLFKRWVTSEVLPSIRKTGTYLPSSINADFVLRLGQAMKEKELELQAKDKQILKLAPKAEFYDEVAKSDTLLTMDQVAKTLGYMGRNKLFQELREKKVLMRNNIPYQSFVDQKLFQLRVGKYANKDEKTGIYTQTMVTGKGLDFIRKTLKKEAQA